MALATAGASAATASPTWLPPAQLSPSGTGTAELSAAMAGDGSDALAWLRSSAVFASTRGPFGSQTPEVQLSALGETPSQPQVAASSAGLVTVVWFNTAGLVEESTGSPGGSFSSEQPLSASGEPAQLPVVAMNDRGDTVVAWIRSNGSNNLVQARFRPAGGAFGAVATLSQTTEDAESPQVAIDAAGDATVVWDRSNGTNKIEQQSTRSAASGIFSPAADLSATGHDATNGVVAMDSAGDTASVWTQDGSAYEARLRPAGGSFSASQPLGGANAGDPFAAVGVDGAGNATALLTTSSSTIVSRTAPVSGSFAAATPVTPSGQSGGQGWNLPVIAVDQRGDAIAAFQDFGLNEVVASYRPAGGGWIPPADISNAPSNAAGGVGHFDYGAGIDAQGDALVGFSASIPPDFSTLAQAEFLDAAPPVVQSFSAPTNAVAGSPVSFSVSAADQLSPPVTANWSFGDGITASGGTVSHAFASPGTYSATVTVTDALGNSATRTAVVQVSAAQSKPPPPPFFGTVSLAHTSLKADRRGRVSLSVRCPSVLACTGTVFMTLQAHGGGGLRFAARSSSLTVLLGRASFSASAGRSATVTIRLPSRFRNLLGKRRSLRVTVLLYSHDSLGRESDRSERARIAAPKHRKHR